MQKRGLARAGHASDRHEHAQRNVDVDVLQIVRPRSADFDLLRSRLAPRQRGSWIRKSSDRYRPVSEAGIYA